MAGGPPKKRVRKDVATETSSSDPCIVVLVKGLSELATEADLIEALSHFGCVSYVSCVPDRKIAFVEFEEPEQARSCVEYANFNAIYVAGQPARFEYSTVKKIQRVGLESEKPNHVLILTIYNAVYPINVNVIHRICSPYGKVRRIVIIRRNSIQSLVEYDSAEEAKRAKRAINGADIYTGCCTLKVEFAKPELVNVQKNDMDSWDYTKFAEPAIMPSLLNISPTETGAPHGVGEIESPVVMVYGIDRINFNCRKLFNLFCLYGNCERVKFIHSKQDTAMVQMGDRKQAYVAIINVNGLEVFGTKLTVKGSKQHEVLLINPFRLEDGSASVESFSNSKNQRYSTPEAAAKNRIVPPVKMLHWFNAPPEVPEHTIGELIASTTTNAPISVVKFAPRPDSRSSKGICMFDSVRAAAEAVILANHLAIHSPASRYPYILRLTFADTAHSPN